MYHLRVANTGRSCLSVILCCSVCLFNLGSETQLDTSTEDGSISDKTLVETQENALESGSDSTSTTTTETSSNSTYLKKMLADAMVTNRVTVILTGF